MITLPNTAGMRYFRTRPELWLQVGSDRYPISDVVVNFSQNSIPTCAVSIPAGVNTSTGKRLELPAAASNVAGIGVSATTAFLQRADVVMRLTGDATPSGAWPDEELTLFEGAIVGRGYTRGTSQLNVTIQLIHWLHQLDSTSALSGATHPGGATDATFRAVFGNSAGGARPAFISDNYSDAAINNPTSISSDVWGAALQPLFVQLAAENVIWMSEVNSLCGEEIKNGNAAAAEALKRMVGGKYHQKLALAAADERDVVAGKLLGWLQGRLNETLVTSSLWEKLIGELSPGLMFTVIPRVADALVVPQQLACREVWKTVYYDDTQQLQTFHGSRRPIRGVLAFGQSTDRSSLTNENLAIPGACFLPEAASAGMIMHTVVPSWMSGLATSISTPSNTSLGKRGSGSGTSLPIQRNTDDADSRNRAASIESSYCRRYAEWVYYTEALRNTHCRIAGPLRFDICPGATIRLAPRQPHAEIAKASDLESYVAHVVGLSISISAETLNAETTFELSHLRTDAENEDARFSSDVHAIYGKLFPGAPLIDELNYE